MIGRVKRLNGKQAWFHPSPFYSSFAPSLIWGWVTFLNYEKFNEITITLSFLRVFKFVNKK